MTTMTTQAGIPTLSLPEQTGEQTKQRTRTRSGSLLKVEQVGEGSAEQDLDQNLYVNINADWVNMKGEHDSRSRSLPILRACSLSSGAWLVHPVLVFCGKIVVDTIPGMNQEISWTLTNLLYLLVSPAHRLRPAARSRDNNLTQHRYHISSFTGQPEFHSSLTFMAAHTTS